MTRLTALIIQNNPSVYCDVGGPNNQGLFAGWILLGRDRWHPLLSTKAIFKSKRSALFTMRQIVKKVKYEEPSRKEAG